MTIREAPTIPKTGDAGGGPKKSSQTRANENGRQLAG